MPVGYERDDARQCVLATIKGPFQVDDLLAIMARQRAERTWTYGILYDLRGMTGEPTIADLQLLSETARGYLGQPPSGPVALLTVDPTLYERLSTYAALARSPADDRCVSRLGKGRALVDDPRGAAMNYVRAWAGPRSAIENPKPSTSQGRQIAAHFIGITSTS